MARKARTDEPIIVIRPNAIRVVLTHKVVEIGTKNESVRQFERAMRFLEKGQPA
jgi:hypothetical protein